MIGHKMWIFFKWPNFEGVVLFRIYSSVFQPKIVTDEKFTILVPLSRHSCKIIFSWDNHFDKVLLKQGKNCGYFISNTVWSLGHFFPNSLYSYANCNLQWVTSQEGVLGVEMMEFAVKRIKNKTNVMVTQEERKTFNVHRSQVLLRFLCNRLTQIIHPCSFFSVLSMGFQISLQTSLDELTWIILIVILLQT